MVKCIDSTCVHLWDCPVQTIQEYWVHVHSVIWRLSKLANNCTLPHKMLKNVHLAKELLSKEKLCRCGFCCCRIWICLKHDGINDGLQVERSVALLKRLTGERGRWEQGSETFKNQMSTIIGDVLLMSAFMAYAGTSQCFLITTVFTCCDSSWLWPAAVYSECTVLSCHLLTGAEPVL